ncbi:MAG: hypothetical protein JWP69_1746 [Flaviaesturariibacter sp.]|nr:hypothetical protein [Flaviaesturariibacter sp.]
MDNGNLAFGIPFQSIDWNTIEKVVYKGERGAAYWQTLHYAGLRIRVVEYSADYFADHWCRKGHFVQCLEGEFLSQMEDGSNVHLKKGMSYIVSDELSSHRSLSITGATLLIIDGDFLKINHPGLNMDLLSE